MGTGGCIIGRTTHVSTDGNVFGLENRISGSAPLGLVTVNGFEEGLPNVKVRPFCYAVSVLVVTRYADVVQVVLLGEVCNCFDDRGPVIGNDFVKSAPTADDVFKYPLSDSVGIFSSEHAEFGIVD